MVRMEFGLVFSIESSGEIPFSVFFNTLILTENKIIERARVRKYFVVRVCVGVCAWFVGQ